MVNINKIVSMSKGKAAPSGWSAKGVTIPPKLHGPKVVKPKSKY